MLLGVDLVLDRIYPEAKLISSWGLTQLHYLDIYLQTCVYLKDAGIGEHVIRRTGRMRDM